MNRPASTPFVAAGPARITTAEFERMCRADVFGDAKIELVDGELQRMMSPMAQHGSYQAAVIRLLAGVIGSGKIGQLLGETGIDLGDDSVVACDAALLLAPMDEHRWLRPSEVLLVIEIAQTTVARDLGLKLSRYASAGIPFYWVVDADRRVIHVHAEPVSDGYKLPSTVRFGEPLAVPGTGRTIVID